MFDVDPEARPSVAQLLDMAKAIHMGKPLPPYEISEEVKSIRAEREVEEQRRAAVQRKKGASKESFNAGVNKKQEGQKVFSSAAARRLGECMCYPMYYIALYMHYLYL